MVLDRGLGERLGFGYAVVLVQCVFAFRLQQLPWIPHILVTLSAFPVVGGIAGNRHWTLT